MIRKNYRTDVDGLRSIAVAIVIAFHAFPVLVPGGFSGVDIFFVISGYLISTTLFGEFQLGTFRFRDFFARRVRRLFPALFLVLGASTLFGAIPFLRSAVCATVSPA